MAEDFHRQDTQPSKREGGRQKPVPLPPMPEKVGPYKIEALIERGGMSILYLATHPETGSPLTIKVLLPQFLGRPEVVDRFLKEAEIIAMANHPNIVQLYGHGEWEGGRYIAMEYIQGTSLREVIAKRPMSLRRALETLLEISYALCHLHTHGVIHRDLKPENILITETGQVKVIDFGIAQLLSDDGSALDNAEQFIGTPVYMSPEQRRYPGNVSYPSDIYSLGIIAYELVLGRLSHGKIQINLMPTGLRKIIAKALQPKIEDRYQDVVDFIADIANYLNSKAILKERKGTDELSILSENLQSAQLTLLPAAPPDWRHIDVGVASHRGLSISGVYYDFFELDDGAYGVLMAEPTAKGVQGMAYIAVLRGMVRTLAHLTQKPGEMVTLLNELLVDDPIDQVFTLNYLILNTLENRFRYISCGYGNLWQVQTGSNTPRKIQSENIALGIEKEVEFMEITQSWNVGDRLLINTFAALNTRKEDRAHAEQQFVEDLVENLYKPAQKQVDTIFYKTMSNYAVALEDHNISLISLHRKA